MQNKKCEGQDTLFCCHGKAQHAWAVPLLPTHTSFKRLPAHIMHLALGTRP